MINVAAIVLNYNGYDETINFLDKIREIELINYIVIIDNHSSDNSYTMIKEHLARDLASIGKIFLIRAPHNAGYAAGNNFGMRFALENFDVELFLISNPDVMFGQDTIECLLDFYQLHKERIRLGAFAPSQLNNLKSGYLTSWSLPNWLSDCLGSFLLIGKLVGKLKRIKINKSVDYTEVDVVNGAFFAIPTKSMEKVGLFDIHTFLFCEERILGKKLKNNGFHSFELTNCFYEHKQSTTIKSNIKLIDRFNILNKSRYYYLTKYFNLSIPQKFVVRFCFAFGIFEKKIYFNLRSFFKK
ncbi:glycosyltransferase [Oenococcus oeni]|uniref:glycosyltransferase n=2 Tax=Oenococcus oeni TaxID=1247 RepID=UPI00050E3E53|nr:glycosyltransferase family 2 protein [Oenococcus oeni]KGH55589.1 hypothetical protein X463_06640 [Oenococcus oeni S22]KGH88671.1 hypothetical protein X296_07855 [Oenococcus oeni IOEB_L26_1]OIK60870.1 hypothetical protein ATW62_09685 [Oenococcus oeni]OIK78690.1 hypothetical protein ATW73_09445 [Oenococcus oeni]OIL89272.1 hypothetical protein ATX42_07390 [Oenococcus oeni]